MTEKVKNITTLLLMATTFFFVIKSFTYVKDVLTRQAFLVGFLFGISLMCFIISLTEEV